jgi:hypothetical protein
MNIYKECAISASLGITNIYELVPDFNPLEQLKFAEKSHWGTTGFQWTGPMEDYHAQTWKGDNRTEAQKEASKKHSEKWHAFGKTPTPKGGTLSEAHKKSLRKPKQSMSFKEYTCPHCHKYGKGNTMKRWHFDNCKVKV